MPNPSIIKYYYEPVDVIASADFDTSDDGWKYYTDNNDNVWFNLYGKAEDLLGTFGGFYEENLYLYIEGDFKAGVQYAVTTIDWSDAPNHETYLDQYRNAELQESYEWKTFDRVPPLYMTLDEDTNYVLLLVNCRFNDADDIVDFGINTKFQAPDGSWQNCEVLHFYTGLNMFRD